MSVETQERSADQQSFRGAAPSGSQSHGIASGWAPDRQHEPPQAREDQPDQPQIRLVVQQEPLQAPRGPLMRLAKFLGLNVWGDSMLGQRVGREMGAAALVLLAVLLFELFAWTLLFNVMVHLAEWRISAKTLIAVFLGALFSAVVFVFERSFITTDFSEGAIRKVFAYGLRVIIIVGSALATAQPVELLVFGGAIDQRLHEENVLAEAVRLLKDYEENVEKAGEVSLGEVQAENRDTQQYQDWSNTRQDLETLQSEIIALERKRDDAAREVKKWSGSVPYWETQQKVAQRELAEARRMLGTEAEVDAAIAAARKKVVEADRSLPFARRKLAEARELDRVAEQNLKDARSREPLVRSRLETDKGVYDNLVKTERERKEKLAQLSDDASKQDKNWIQLIQRSPPGEVIVDPITGRELKPKQADFTERLRILEDLLQARSARWPRRPAEVLDAAAQEFELDAWVVDPEAGSEDPLAQRMQGDAVLFQRIYRVAFIVALVIPLLTMAFKLLMSKELRSYYSTKAQARALNPEAVAALEARGE